MKNYIALSMAVAALALTACTADEVKQQNAQQGQIPIRLTASLNDNMTRAFTLDRIPKDTKVYVWADMINLSDSHRSEYFKGWELLAGVRPGELESDDVKFFPATNVLDLYAMVGTFSGYSINTKNPLPTAGIYHTVRDNQVSEGAYYASDLLYAQVRNQEPVAEATGVELKFYHMLSKVRVVLIPGTGSTANDAYDNDLLKTATVTLLDLETRARFTPAKEVAQLDFQQQATRAAMVAAAPKNANDAEDYQPRRDMVIATGVPAYDAEGKVVDSSYGDAVIVPQTVSAGEFIKVTLTDPGTGLTEDTYFCFDDDFTFESGKQYQFRLTLDRIGRTYSVTPTISDWTSEATARDVDMKQSSTN